MTSRLLRFLRLGRRLEVKTDGELDAMRDAGLLVARTLVAVTEATKAGVSTGELDALAEQTIRDGGGIPSFLGYHGFPASICASVNDEVVHGIPSDKRILADGDLLSVDCGAILDGWHGDSAVTIAVGKVSEMDTALSEATRAVMQAGIDAAVPGGRLTDISHAVESAAARARRADGVDYGLITEYGGHGIGREMHMDPFLPNAGKPNRGPRLRPGATLAVEPMLTAGSAETRELDDDWTVVTADGSRASHWEHTIAVTQNGPKVLTAIDAY